MSREEVATILKKNPSRKLSLGCGDKPKPGWVNLDVVKLTGVDVVHDLTDVPLPFPDNYFEVIFAEQVLDHFRSLKVIQDLNRILAPSGQLIIEVAHFSSYRNYNHLEHVQLYSVDTFEWYIAGTKSNKIGGWYAPFKFSGYAKQYISFDHSLPRLPNFLNKLMEKWVNKNHRRQQLYEATGLCHLFPALNLYITLVK